MRFFSVYVNLSGSIGLSSASYLGPLHSSIIAFSLSLSTPRTSPKLKQQFRAFSSIGFQESGQNLKHLVKVELQCSELNMELKHLLEE